MEVSFDSNRDRKLISGFCVGQTVYVSDTIIVNSDYDAGGKTYIATNALVGSVFDVQSGSLRNAAIIGTDIAQYGVKVSGNNVTVENVVCEHFQRGFQIEHCKNVIIRKCTARYNGQFGFMTDTVDTALFEDCEGAFSILDGLKLLSQSTYITVTRGNYHHNGTTQALAGDGIDVFAGGMHVLIDGANCHDNHGNGITVKTDTLTRDKPEVYGVVTDVTLRDCICTNNTGWGAIAISGFVPDVPLLDNVTILRGQYKTNRNSGLLINANHVTVTDADCTGNTVYGVDVDTRTINLTLNNVSGSVNTR